MRNTRTRQIDIHKKIRILREGENVIFDDDDGKQGVKKPKRIVELPIPPTREIENYTDTLKDRLHKFVEPVGYVRKPATGSFYEEYDYVDYDYDEEDEKWLAKLRHHGSSAPIANRLSPYTFEKIIDTFERRNHDPSFGNTEEISLPVAIEAVTEALEEAAAQLEAKEEPRPPSLAVKTSLEVLRFPLPQNCPLRSAEFNNLIQEIYNYWLQKRRALKKPLLRRFWPPTSITDNNSHHTFRPHERTNNTHRLRRSRRNDVDTYKRLKALKADMEGVYAVFEAMKERETLKQDLIKAQEDIFQMSLSELANINMFNLPLVNGRTRAQHLSSLQVHKPREQPKLKLKFKSSMPLHQQQQLQLQQAQQLEEAQAPKPYRSKGRSMHGHGHPSAAAAAAATAAQAASAGRKVEDRGLKAGVGPAGAVPVTGPGTDRVSDRVTAIHGAPGVVHPLIQGHGPSHQKRMREEDVKLEALRKFVQQMLQEQQRHVSAHAVYPGFALGPWTPLMSNSAELESCVNYPGATGGVHSHSSSAGGSKGDRADRVERGLRHFLHIEESGFEAEDPLDLSRAAGTRRGLILNQVAWKKLRNTGELTDVFPSGHLELGPQQHIEADPAHANESAKHRISNMKLMELRLLGQNISGVYTGGISWEEGTGTGLMAGLGSGVSPSGEGWEFVASRLESLLLPFSQPFESSFGSGSTDNGMVSKRVLDLAKQAILSRKRRRLALSNSGVSDTSAHQKLDVTLSDFLTASDIITPSAGSTSNSSNAAMRNRLALVQTAMLSYTSQFLDGNLNSDIFSVDNHGQESVSNLEGDGQLPSQLHLFETRVSAPFLRTSTSSDSCHTHFDSREILRPRMARGGRIVIDRIPLGPRKARSSDNSDNKRDTVNRRSLSFTSVGALRSDIAQKVSSEMSTMYRRNQIIRGFVAHSLRHWVGSATVADVNTVVRAAPNAVSLVRLLYTARQSSSRFRILPTPLSSRLGSGQGPSGNYTSLLPSGFMYHAGGRKTRYTGCELGTMASPSRNAPVAPMFGCRDELSVGSPFISLGLSHARMSPTSGASTTVAGPFEVAQASYGVSTTYALTVLDSFVHRAVVDRTAALSNPRVLPYNNSDFFAESMNSLQLEQVHQPSNTTSAMIEALFDPLLDAFVDDFGLNTNESKEKEKEKAKRKDHFIGASPLLSVGLSNQTNSSFCSNAITAAADSSDEETVTSDYNPMEENNSWNEFNILEGPSVPPDSFASLFVSMGNILPPPATPTTSSAPSTKKRGVKRGRRDEVEAEEMEDPLERSVAASMAQAYASLEPGSQAAVRAFVRDCVVSKPPLQPHALLHASLGSAVAVGKQHIPGVPLTNLKRFFNIPTTSQITEAVWLKNFKDTMYHNVPGSVQSPNGQPISNKPPLLSMESDDESWSKNSNVFWTAGEADASLLHAASLNEIYSMVSLNEFE